MSSIVIVVVALGALAWLALLVSSGMRGRGREEVPPNLDPYKTDDEMENRRLDRVLSVAVILSAVLAISLPVYWLGEIDRQEGFDEQFHEEAVERGEHHVEEFACASCHGAGLVGGVASYVDERSGVTVAWAAPALNDIFYRYSEDEVRFWLVYGRPNSPMPPWGLDGGGPMNEQQIDEIIEYLHTIQISQTAALAQVDGNVEFALSALEGAEASVMQSIEDQEALVDSIQRAPEDLAAIAPLAEAGRDALDAAEDGIDVDDDGLSDAAESALTRVSAAVADTGYGSFTAQTWDPRNPDTVGTGAGDEQAAVDFVSALETAATQLGVAAERQDVLLDQAEAGLSFLRQAAERRDYEFDFDAVAAAAFGGDTGRAERAVGLYQSYCSACHTSGASSGPAFAQPAGSGALGPALWEGRANVQFTSADELKQFLANGSELGIGYGVNGIGRGYMPGFGQVLSEQDLDLIVAYLRGGVLR